jgi:MarR family transcriptional regulator for hemolysin
MTLWESVEHEIVVLLRHLDLAYTKARRNELEPLGITPPQIGILHFVQKSREPCTVIQLRKLMRHSNSALVALLNRMERKGLLKRQPDTASKKYTRIYLTEKGRDIYKRAMRLDSFVTIISSLPEDDQQRLKSYLATLTEATQKFLGEKSFVT